MTKRLRLACIAILLAFCLSVVTHSLAQEEKAEGRLQQLSQQLNLTDDQKEKLKPTLREEGEKLQAVRDDAALTRPQKMAKAKEIHSAYAPKIDGILTPEQKAKWKQMREQEMRNR